MIRGKNLSDIAKVAMTIILLIVANTVMPTPAKATDAADAQGLVDKARITFGEFMRDKQYWWFQEHLKEAKGLLIYPQVVKGGFVFGGSGGNGVLVVKDERTGDWGQPAFYTIGSVTFGLQIGGESSEIVVLVMSQKAINSLLASSLKLGGDVSVALGPVGGGAKGTVTADLISFAKSVGLYAGISLEGSVVGVRDTLNSAYYGREVSPIDIIILKKVDQRRVRQN